MALTLKQTPLEWFNPEGYNLIGAINVFDKITSTSIAIRDNYDIIIYYNNITQSYPSGSVIGNLLTLMEVDSGYVSNLKIRRGLYLTISYYLIVEFTNPQGKYEYKMLCFTINGEAHITLNFINTHTPNSRSNIAEILSSTPYVGFLFDLNTIYTYKSQERFEEADNTSFSNVIENINTFIFEDIPGELTILSAGFNYDNENISFGQFYCDGTTWSLESSLTVPIAQGQYFIQNKSSFIFAGTNSLFYFINYTNSTLSLVSVNPETFVIFNISSIECNTPINDVYSKYVVNLDEPLLISLISNQSFTNLIQVVNETTTYTATFRNYDNTLLYETEVNEGETPSYVGPIPTRQGDNLYDYTFTGWNPELAPITQDTTYIAQFRPVRKQVQVTFENYDGTILEQKNIGKGTEPTYTGTTPTKPSDDLYDYTFSGWEPELGVINQDTTYTAQFTSTRKQVQVTFKNYDETILEQKDIDKGTTPTYTGATPTRPSDNLYDYTFNGWEPELGVINQDTTYTAQFTSVRKKYQATFRNYDNTLLYETEVNAGETPSYVGLQPTRPSDNLNDFTFSGWNPELAPIIEDTTYIAQFTSVRKQVQVTFKNYNGVILEQKDIDKGTKPTYTGETPTRPSDNYYTYEFTGREPELGIVMSDRIYTATYKNTFRTYVCTFKDYDGTTIDTQTITAGQYATSPDFKGTQTGYTFTGWNPDPISTQILNDTTFNAVYVKGIAINLYVNTAENDRVDKTNYLNQVGTLVGIFKEETSVMNPEIIIEYGVIDFNYIYIPVLNRYYYINEIISVRNNLWRVRLNCDVLMSFKTEILNLECYVSRNEYKNNPYVEDTFLPLLFNRDIVEVESPVYSGLENYQFTNNFTIFINTIYQNEAVETIIGNRVINVLPFNNSGDILGESYSYQEGETSFNIVSYIKTDEKLETNIGRLVNFLHINSETIGSYVLSVVCLPIKNPTSTFLWVNGAQESSEIPVGDGNPTVDIPCVIGEPTGSLPPFELNIITFTPKFNNFLDYEPYSKYEIYIPYYGWLTLKSNDILNKQVHVIYKLQTDGSSGMVFVTTDTKLLFSSEISIAVVFPISTTNKEIIDRQATSQLLNMIMSGVLGTASIGVGGGMALTGAKLGVQLMGLGMMSGGIQQALKGMTSGFSNLNELIETGSGSVGSNKSSAWNPKKVRTRITSPQIAVDDLEKYAKYIGRPLQENYTLSELNGYTIVGGVHVENIGLATEEEKTEIEKTLRSGFILPDKTT